jgi:cobalamin 5'-phosphate synthase/cobalamin synthase
MRDLKAAFSLLTILPVPGAQLAPRSAAVMWFPVVGVVIGVVVAGVLLLPLPALPRAALALGVWILCSGALHEDGLMDSADAALAPVLPERRSAIRKDPRVGAFAVTAAGILMIARFAALTEVPVHAALLAPIVGRWCMSCTLALPYATGGSSLTAQLARPRVPIGATLIAGIFVAALAWWFADLRALSATALGLAAGLLTALLLARRLGELSGDVHGAAAVIAETFILYSFLPIGR